ncbi:hypothetical protein ACRALDRAFT_1081364 [Sodiomyces alcalophilus JCM 7366]|uniref:uncharacterized protein n=1 Tax=Sodiomyces alcalophilus JCM 7366 TaxID=591952 RepID=UPI0039B56D81
MAVRTSPSKRPLCFPVLSLLTTFILTLVLLSALLSLDPCLTLLGKGHCYGDYHSEYSFDVGRLDHSSWMQSIPDDTNLTSLSIPGTHDTLTFDMRDETYQCQNHNLSAQLRAGIRYLDVRGRLTNNSILIYHADRYTGYTYTDVLLTVFDFLDQHPSETIVMRLKEEGRPYGRNDRTFEEAFNHYLHNDTDTAPRAQVHFYMPDTFLPLPTLGALRGKILLLQQFPTATAVSPAFFNQAKMTRSPAPKPGSGSGRYGIVWESRVMVLQDLWIIPSLQHLDMKWDAIEAALIRAAETSHPADRANDALHLSHLSASVGVLPIEAAAGSRDGSVVGMNDRTGRWLVEQAVRRGEEGQQSYYGRTGIVIMDFPGQDLVDAVLERNSGLAVGAWPKRTLRVMGRSPLLSRPLHYISKLLPIDSAVSSFAFF